MALLSLLILSLAVFAWPISSLKFETRQFINKGNRLQNEIKIQEPVRLAIKPEEREFLPNYRKISVLSPFTGMFVLFETLGLKCEDGSVQISYYNSKQTNHKKICSAPNNTDIVIFEATNTKLLYFDLKVLKKGLSISLDIVVIPTVASNCSLKGEVRVQNSCFEKKYHDELCALVPMQNLTSLNCPGKKG